MLPGLDGIGVCEQIRAESGVPIIMLTARTDTRDVVRGLEVGADDYVVEKPFNPAELIARIRARLREPQEETNETLTIGDLQIDVAGHEVKRGDEVIALTPLEFDLLATPRAEAPAGLHPRGAPREGVGLPVQGRYAARERACAAAAREDRGRSRSADNRDDRAQGSDTALVPAQNSRGQMTEPKPRGRVRRAWRRLRLRWLKLSQPILGPFRARWRRSLMLRTMTITGLVTGAMVAVAGVFLLTSVSNDLYSSRRDQALQDSARVTVQAQRIIDSYDPADRGGLQSLQTSVLRTVQDTSASQMIYIRRQQNQAPFLELSPVFSTPSALGQAVSEELSNAVLAAEAPQYWQAVTFREEGAKVYPGIVVGSSLKFPAGAGVFDLFIGYDLTDTSNTLSFVQRTLLITAAGMMLFIGLLVWVISRIVFRPIRVAADTSRRLASGEANARMPKQHDEHFDVLSDGFNDMADTLQARSSRSFDELSEMQQRFVSDVSHESAHPPHDDPPRERSTQRAAGRDAAWPAARRRGAERPGRALRVRG